MANGWDFNHQRSKSFRFQGWPGRCAHAYVASIYGAVSMAQANTPISLGRDVPGMGKATGNRETYGKMLGIIRKLYGNMGETMKHLWDLMKKIWDLYRI